MDPQINSSLFSYILIGPIFSVLLNFSHKNLHHKVPCGVVYQIRIIHFLLSKISQNPFKYFKYWCWVFVQTFSETLQHIQSDEDFSCTNIADSVRMVDNILNVSALSLGRKNLLWIIGSWRRVLKEYYEIFTSSHLNRLIVLNKCCT